MQYLLRRVTASRPGMPAGSSVTTVSQPAPAARLYSRILLGLTVAGLGFHVLVLNSLGLQNTRSLLSNLVQLGLGILAVLAFLDARKRSSRFGRRTWSLAALAVGVYTAGQAIFTYYEV